MQKSKVSYNIDRTLGDFIFSFGHPMKPMRINMVNELVKSYGLDHWLCIRQKKKKISLQELENFHDETYLTNILHNQKVFTSNQIELYFPPNKGDDCPIFSGLSQFINSYTQASIQGAEDICQENVEVSINWSGGFHHAKSFEASGFCYVNDIVIAILWLLKTFKKVLYIDIDAHHGDGVEEAFQLSQRVFCLSFHNY